MKKSSGKMSDTYEELGSLENERSQDGRVLAGHLLLKYCITYFSLIKRLQTVLWLQTRGRGWSQIKMARDTKHSRLKTEINKNVYRPSVTSWTKGQRFLVTPRTLDAF